MKLRLALACMVLVGATAVANTEDSPVEIKTGDPVPLEIWNAAQEARKNHLSDLLQKLGVQNNSYSQRLTAIEDSIVKLANTAQALLAADSRLKLVEEYVTRIEKDAAAINQGAQKVA